ncbi:phosphoribosylformimino-5-aminoimidazole carboxamide ribonucleotide ProFAR isomerase [Serpentinimonas maccroryi]|uniref:Phosphoribosylformimino-5-aminoimidazole carboxamide ribonucleotide ProFAR isomerase n=2 Tax=Serpentinimonas maccroryi TaxID=1458426 RepID=A0A060NTR8_9BURK|nr:phosphoribosylformimino-5-aminoimidazole carboxamide ribonucleotide ProFAR isomerase [Serpentinimonas maccroryi]
MDADFMDRLQALRSAFARPMLISSGYRDPTHPLEAIKSQPGSHASGRAVDVSVRGAEALQLIALAVQHGFTGIGVQQKGSGRFIHLDDLSAQAQQPRPTIWSY